MTNLLNCPFCGEIPELQDHCSAWGVHCKCGASVIGPRADMEEEHPESYYLPFKQGAIDKWNRRSGPEPSFMGIKVVSDPTIAPDEMQMRSADEPKPPCGCLAHRGESCPNCAPEITP